MSPMNAGGPCNYALNTVEETNLFVGVGTEKTDYKPNEPITIYAYMQDAGLPRSGATIRATVVKPNGSTALLFLLDDGTHGDGAAGDGIYATRYGDSSQSGVYKVRLDASIAKDGALYGRNASTVVFVGTSPDLVISDSDIAFSNTHPSQGDTVNISATIHNIGDADYQAARTLFFDGDPAESGIAVGEAEVAVPAGSDAAATVAWRAIRGVHTIHVIISPFTEPLEQSYDNNRAKATITVNDIEAPVADAGPDQTVLVDTPVFFDGGKSTDNAGITEYKWDVDASVDSDGDGISDNDVDLTGVNPALINGYHSTGDYVVKLYVNDADGNGPVTDTLVVHVTSDYDIVPPTAVAGPDQTVKLKQPVFFDGSRSSDNFAIARYLWDIDTSVDSDGDGIADNDIDLMGVRPVLSRGYAKAGSYTVKLTVDDVAGNGPADDTLTVRVINTPPVAKAGGPYAADEGAMVILDAKGSTDPDGDALQYRWDFDQDGTWDTGWSTISRAYYAWPDDHAGLVSVEVSDGDSTVIDTASITVSNVPPIATLLAPVSLLEGDRFNLSLVNAYDPSPADTAAGFTYAFDCGDGSGYSSPAGESSVSCSAIDNPGQTVRAKIIDKNGGLTEYSATFTVVDVPPKFVAITWPVAPMLLGTPATVTARFTDQGILDTHTATLDWGDGNSSSGVIVEPNGSTPGTISGTHTYAFAGFYDIKLTALGKDSGRIEAVFRYTIVYEGKSGFVTAGGWFNSPPGAYKSDPRLTGRSHFGFNAKYQQGATVPRGELEFQFQKAGLNFHAKSYRGLVIHQNDRTAHLMGAGTVNGADAPNGQPYYIMVWARDENPDALRIRIWYEENDAEHVVYDTGVAQRVSGGSIVIHKR